MHDRPFLELFYLRLSLNIDTPLVVIDSGYRGYSGGKWMQSLPQIA